MIRLTRKKKKKKRSRYLLSPSKFRLYLGKQLSFSGFQMNKFFQQKPLSSEMNTMFITIDFVVITKTLESNQRKYVKGKESNFKSCMVLTVFQFSFFIIYNNITTIIHFINSSRLLRLV